MSRRRCATHTAMWNPLRVNPLSQQMPRAWPKAVRLARCRISWFATEKRREFKYRRAAATLTPPASLLAPDLSRHHQLAPFPSIFHLCFNSVSITHISYQYPTPFNPRVQYNSEIASCPNFPLRRYDRREILSVLRPHPSLSEGRAFTF